MLLELIYHRFTLKMRFYCSHLIFFQQIPLLLFLLAVHCLLLTESIEQSALYLSDCVRLLERLKEEAVILDDFVLDFIDNQLRGYYLVRENSRVEHGVALEPLD